MKLILVVEDHAATRAAMVRLLALDGWQSIGVETAEQAFIFMREHMPAAILLDMMLPGMNGLQFLEHQRNDPRLLHIPVIAFSAAEFMREPALSGGANAFFVKGVAQWSDVRDGLKTASGSSQTESCQSATSAPL